MKVKPGSLDTQVMVRNGLMRERHIADALRDQIGLPIRNANQYEDRILKVDRWLVYPDRRVALQIKYRENGKDLLFEVYDTFHSWDDPKNKLGRDMYGEAAEYAVLMQDRKTIVMVPTDLAKETIYKMVEQAKKGWSVMSVYGNTLRYHESGCELNLKQQKDPQDKRWKMVAYIPADFFVAKEQASVYQVKLPAWN